MYDIVLKLVHNIYDIYIYIYKYLQINNSVNIKFQDLKICAN
jgi:hypothetical protein